MDIPLLRNGRFHERACRLYVPPEFPFEEALIPDIYPRQYSRPSYVDRNRYQPRIANRTSRTNLWTYSNAYDLGAWTLNSLAQLTPAANPRDGALSAQNLTETGSSPASPNLTRNYTFTSEAWHCLSAFAAFLGRDWILLRAYDGTQYHEGWFNLSTGQTAAATIAPLISPSVRNGGFEDAGGGGADVFDDWTEELGGGTSTVNRDTVLFDAGAVACRLDVDSGGNYAMVRQNIFQAGRRYRVSVRACNSPGATLVVVGGAVDIVIPITGAFTTYTTDVTTAGVLIGLKNVTPSTSVWIDQVTITPLDAPILTMTRCPFPGDDFWRCGMAFYPRAAAGSGTLLVSNDGTTATYALDSAKGVTLWGMQLELGTAPGPQIDTLGFARTISAPDTDSDDIFAWQVGESKPAVVSGDLMRVDRAFARIPAEQVTEDSQAFARPPLHDLKSGSTYAVCFTPERDRSHLFTTGRKAVSTLGDAVATFTSEGNARGVLPHAQITIQLTNSSQSFYADDSDSTIKNALSTALQGNTSAASDFVIQRNADGFVVTYVGTIGGNYRFYTLTCASVLVTVLPNLAIVPGALYGPPAMELVTVQANERAVPAQRTITTSTSHGGAAGGLLAAWNGDRLVGTTQAISASGSTLVIPANEAPWNNASLAITHVGFATQAATCLANGSKDDCVVRHHRQFYLPGVTMLSSGTTMAAGTDLVPESVYRDPQPWLDAIVAGTAFVVIAAGSREKFMGPLMSRTITKIQMSTALDSLTP